MAADRARSASHSLRARRISLANAGKCLRSPGLSAPALLFSYGRRLAGHWQNQPHARVRNVAASVPSYTEIQPGQQTLNLLQATSSTRIGRPAEIARGRYRLQSP